MSSVDSGLVNLSTFFVQDCHRQICDVVETHLCLYGFSNLDHSSPASGPGLHNALTAWSLLSNFKRILFGDGSPHESVRLE